MYVVLIWEDEATVEKVIGPFFSLSRAKRFVEENNLSNHATVYEVDDLAKVEG